MHTYKKTVIGLGDGDHVEVNSEDVVVEIHRDSNVVDGNGNQLTRVIVTPRAHMEIKRTDNGVSLADCIGAGIITVAVAPSRAETRDRDS